MSEGEYTRVWYVEIWYKLQRLYSDILYLFEPNKLFVFSWMKFKGTKMLHNNWGDDINKYFIESISKLKVKNIPRSILYRLFPVQGYTCIGSVLEMYPAKNFEVWGSGIMVKNKKLISIPKKIHSVRGPLTRQSLLNQGSECPEVYGDPALLISRYYRKYVDRKYSCGIIPHYCDENNPILQDFCRRHPEYLLIKMRDYDDWHDIPDQIMQCSRIISSSLHGLIMADSYGVPNAWIQLSETRYGGNFKYHDYFMSVGRVIDEPFYIKSIDDIERIIIQDDMTIAKCIDYRSIFEACPFKEKIIDYNILVPQLPQYESWQDKNKHYYDNIFVRTESQLDEIVKELKTKEKDLLFLGVNEAKYKIFASSQSHWMQMSDCMLSLGTTNYYQAINKLKLLTMDCPEAKRYLPNRGNKNSDMFIFALMLKMGIPSPMICFSCVLRDALFAAVDGIPEWDESEIDPIKDYVSLIFLKKENKWISSFVFNANNKNTNDGPMGHDCIYFINNTINVPLVEAVNNQLNESIFSSLNIHKKLAPYIRENYL